MVTECIKRRKGKKKKTFEDEAQDISASFPAAFAKNPSTERRSSLRNNMNKKYHKKKKKKKEKKILCWVGSRKIQDWEFLASKLKGAPEKLIKKEYKQRK